MNRQRVLVGELVEVRPLRADDFAELYQAAADPLLWGQHPDPWVTVNRLPETPAAVVATEGSPSCGSRHCDC